MNKQMYDSFIETEKDILKRLKVMTLMKQSTHAQIYLKYRLFESTKMHENLIEFILKKIKMDIPTNLLDNVSGNIDVDRVGNKLDIHWSRINKFENDNLINFTEDEFNTIVLCFPKFYIINNEKFAMSFTNGPFTLRQMLDHIIKFEKVSRRESTWCFFEGLTKIKTDKEGNPYYRVWWGS